MPYPWRISTGRGLRQPRGLGTAPHRGKPAAAQGQGWRSTPPACKAPSATGRPGEAGDHLLALSLRKRGVDFQGARRRAGHGGVVVRCAVGRRGAIRAAAGDGSSPPFGQGCAGSACRPARRTRHRTGRGGSAAPELAFLTRIIPLRTPTAFQPALARPRPGKVAFGSHAARRRFFAPVRARLRGDGIRAVSRKTMNVRSLQDAHATAGWATRCACVLRASTIFCAMKADP